MYKQNEKLKLDKIPYKQQIATKKFHFLKAGILYCS